MIMSCLLKDSTGAISSIGQRQHIMFFPPLINGIQSTIAHIPGEDFSLTNRVSITFYENACTEDQIFNRCLRRIRQQPGVKG